MRKFILSFALFAMTFASIYAAPNPNRRLLGESYIEQYRYIAVMESLRTGIPASIKLAQGLLESGFGQGSLALSSNNHFGIKWRSPIDGDYIEAFDDEKDKYGRQKSSRFVKFNTPEESYQQHSEILMTRQTYRLLFIYDRADYRSWAYGLKKAGYATDPKYATKLIQIIEQFHLDRFDIPTQLSLDDTPQYPQPNQSEFSDFSKRDDQPDPSRQSFPTNRNNQKKERKPEKRLSVQSVKNNQEEEHILFEVTTEVASKNGNNTIKSPVPKRQKK